ncbi:hypothetical protein BDFB_008132, partial [Asbolus verrucosus]
LVQVARGAADGLISSAIIHHVTLFNRFRSEHCNFMAVTERDPPDGSAQYTSISRHPVINLLAILFMPSLHTTQESTAHLGGSAARLINNNTSHRLPRIMERSGNWRGINLNCPHLHDRPRSASTVMSGRVPFAFFNNEVRFEQN